MRTGASQPTPFSRAELRGHVRGVALFALAVAVNSMLASMAAAQDRQPAQGSTTAKTRGARRPRAAQVKAGTQLNAELEAANALLASDQRDQVEAGIQSLGLLGVEQAVEPLATRIRKGLPSELLELAITTLTALGQPRAGPILYELALHRRPEVRRQALEAIAATRPRDPEGVLLRALSDEDAQVRAAAAVALGELGTRRSVDRLFVALDRGNGDASAPLGKLVAPGSVSRLNTYLGKVTFAQMTPALATILERSDVAERDKLELIARLQELGTREVKAYLAGLTASPQHPFSPAVQRAIGRAVQQIVD